MDLLKVRRTKKPSVKVALAMASNLRSKFNLYSTVDLSATASMSGKTYCRMRIYVAFEGKSFYDCETWEEIYETYERLMKTGV